MSDQTNAWQCLARLDSTYRHTVIAQKVRAEILEVAQYWKKLGFQTAREKKLQKGHPWRIKTVPECSLSVIWEFVGNADDETPTWSAQ